MVEGKSRISRVHAGFKTIAVTAFPPTRRETSGRFSKGYHPATLNHTATQPPTQAYRSLNLESASAAIDAAWTGHLLLGSCKSQEKIGKWGPN